MNARRVLGIILDYVLLVLSVTSIYWIFSLFINEQVLNWIMMLMVMFTFLFFFGYLVNSKKTIGKKISSLIIKDENKKVTAKQVLIFVVIVLLIMFIRIFLAVI